MSSVDRWESLIVGASDRYRFEVHSPGGAVTRVERSAEAPRISADEADWIRCLQIAVRRAPEGWDGGELRELNQLASPWIDGDRFIMAVADEAGTIRVKEYRLELPESMSRE